MLAGMIAGATLVVAVLMFASFRNADRGRRSIAAFAVLGLFIAGTVIAVVFATDGDDVEPADGFGRSGIAWSDIERASSSLREDQSAVSAAIQAPSVPSLISGLERRLEAAPQDARGWALLAQSYAFMGQSEPAEQALQRAVEFGFDEADLRQRVASATRDPHAGLPATPAAWR